MRRRKIVMSQEGLRHAALNTGTKAQRAEVAQFLNFGGWIVSSVNEFENTAFIVLRWPAKDMAVGIGPDGRTVRPFKGATVKWNWNEVKEAHRAQIAKESNA
jgi:hypothetical protein